MNLNLVKSNKVFLHDLFQYYTSPVSGAFAKLWKASTSFVMSLCPSVGMEQLGSHWTDFHVICNWVFCEKLSRKLQFHQNLTRIRGTLHDDKYTFFFISRSFLPRMRNVSDKRCRETQNTHFVFSVFFKSCRLWNNVEKYFRPGQATDDNTEGCKSRYIVIRVIQSKTVYLLWHPSV